MAEANKLASRRTLFIGVIPNLGRPTGPCRLVIAQLMSPARGGRHYAGPGPDLKAFRAELPTVPFESRRRDISRRRM